jgi:cysteine-rich repeat protein
MTRRPASFLLAALLLAGVARTHAEPRTVTIDETDTATVMDGIIDGFPGIAAKDGTPDLGGNALSVALKTGVTELRGVVEFPLAALAGVSGDAITAATLTFNVDDVLSTFGPGTDFNGQAASTLFVHAYTGNGTVDLGDYNETREAPAAIATGPGAITDATLDASGAAYFTVDVRDRLADAVEAGDDFLGIVWRTDDSPTGTSLDDLGEGSAGPAGARASRLPFLTIEVDDDAPPPVCECGDGVVQGACDEDCDDGNLEPLDGCSPECLHDSYLGGTAATDCLLKIALAQPVRGTDGIIASPQSCRDGDPTCDADPTEGICGFTLAACVGTTDSRIAQCGAPSGAPAAVSVRKPGKKGAQGVIRTALESALAGVVAPGCSDSVTVGVPVKTKGTRRKPGKLKIVLRAKGEGGRDNDKLLLVCEPASS